MYSRPIVPGDFAVPARLNGEGFHLRMLQVEDVIKDFDALIASRAILKGLMSPTDSWPEGLTLTENLIDLGWHQREFTLRHSFAYTVMSRDENRCLGCCYIYPSDRQGYDVMVFYWARGDEWGEGLEAKIGREFRDWLKRDWPFRSIAFPGRDIRWSDWTKLPAK